MKSRSSSKIVLLLIAMIVLSLNGNATTNLIKIKIASGSYSDEIAIRFMVGATAGFDGCCDAWKMFSGNAAVPNIFTKTDIGDELAINSLPPLNHSTAIDIFTRTGVSSTYSITTTELDSFPNTINIVLTDNITGTTYDLKTGTMYTINLPVISISAPARFSLSFTLPVVILSVGLKDFTAQAEKGAVRLSWTTETESSNDYFTMERATASGSNLQWEQIGTLKGAGNSSTIRNYEFEDAQLPSPAREEPGVRYYRLKQTDFNGEYKYFGPISVSVGNSQAGINVYPSISNGTFTLQLTDSDPITADSRIEICNAFGEKVFQRVLISALETINIDVAGGIYFVRVNTSDRIVSKKIVVLK